MADYSFVKNSDGSVRGLWLRNTSQARDEFLLLALLGKHGIPTSLLEKGCRVEPNAVGSDDGFFVPGLPR